MVMVPVKTTVLIAASLLRGSIDPYGPFDTWVIPDINKYLLHVCIKWSVFLKPTYWEINSGANPVIDIAFSSLASTVFPWCQLLFPLSFVML